MSKYNLTLPKMGESVEEATIVNWLKNIGDDIKMDDFIVEVATDKVDSEVPSDVEGVLIEKCFEINNARLLVDSECNNLILLQAQKDSLRNLGIQIEQGESVRL